MCGHAEELLPLCPHLPLGGGLNSGSCNTHARGRYTGDSIITRQSLQTHAVKGGASHLNCRRLRAVVARVGAAGARQLPKGSETKHASSTGGIQRDDGCCRGFRGGRWSQMVMNSLVALSWQHSPAALTCCRPLEAASVFCTLLAPFASRSPPCRFEDMVLLYSGLGLVSTLSPQPTPGCPHTAPS